MNRKSVGMFAVLALLLPLAASAAMPAGLPAVTVTTAPGGGQTYSLTLQILILMTVLSLLPAILLMMTAFTRIVIVLAILSQAIGAGQTPREIGIALVRTGELSCERVGLGDFRATPGRNQPVERTGVSLPAPIAKRRRVDALTAQDRADPASVGGTIDLGQNAQFGLGVEGPPPWTVR